MSLSAETAKYFVVLSLIICTGTTNHTSSARGSEEGETSLACLTPTSLGAPLSERELLYLEMGCFVTTESLLPERLFVSVLFRSRFMASGTSEVCSISKVFVPTGRLLITIDVHSLARSRRPCILSVLSPMLSWGVWLSNGVSIDPYEKTRAASSPRTCAVTEKGGYSFYHSERYFDVAALAFQACTAELRAKEADAIARSCRSGSTLPKSRIDSHITDSHLHPT